MSASVFLNSTLEYVIGSNSTKVWLKQTQQNNFKNSTKSYWFFQWLLRCAARGILFLRNTLFNKHIFLRANSWWKNRHVYFSGKERAATYCIARFAIPVFWYVSIFLQELAHYKNILELVFVQKSLHCLTLYLFPWFVKIIPMYIFRIWYHKIV